ncbi:putative defense protein Hdd11 [Coccinella septempunctata]|uniref:putative defense protein Hdd11 n=1 Tax=Coccinella septempunctata TaxID=41139 RepID=UPI001D068DE4|nr:putative defense protein Hdd11 [Coccinella septempunctata]XP_044751781.1 putative defense protein Hdd11 [Coccinella septempunctata]
MHTLACFALVLSAATCAWAYSSGAPTTVCDDMTPKHPFDPQPSELPYTVSISKKTVKPGEETDITISGKDFKGFLVQVRKGDKAVGSFVIDPKDKDSKALTCHGSSKSSATHSNASVRKSVTLKWKAPQEKGELHVFATVAADGATFWARKNVGKIVVN